MNTKKTGFLVLLTGLALLLVSGCDDTAPVTRDGRTFIEDRTGKQWDVTYAVNELGMNADQFNYGLGPNAIRPITSPQFILPGDDDYPHDNFVFMVLGVTMGNEARAYRITDLSHHEVADDVIGLVAFAAAY